MANGAYTGAKFNLPIPVGRLNPYPVDDTLVWDTYDNANEYSNNGATAYLGELIYCLDTEKYYTVVPGSDLVALKAGDNIEYISDDFINNLFLINYDDKASLIETTDESGLVTATIVGMYETSENNYGTTITVNKAEV